MEDKYLQFKHRLAFSAVVSLFLTMSLFVTAPLSLYANSFEDLWFSFQSLLIPVLVISAAGFLLCTAAAALPKGGVHKLLCCLIFGVALGFYIQGGFFNIGYGSGVLDGSEIVWKDYTTYGAIDSAMWAACAALPFAFFMVFKKQWRHILMVAAVFIMVIQAAGLALTVYQNQGSLDNFTHEVTKDGIYELSDTDNTLVFVLSSMDETYYEDFKKSHEEAEEALGGFTEYKNTLASGAGSIVSFPSMLTGEVYKKDIKYDSYIDKIWSNKNLFSMLDAEGVDARIYSDEIYFSEDAAYTVKNVVGRVQDFDSYKTISKTMYKYTLFNYMPHYLKKFFWLNVSDLSTYQGNSTYTPNNDAVFFDEYDDNGGFDYTSAYDSAVRVYYLKGAATPYRLTSEGKNNIKGTTLSEQVEGEFAYLFKMLDDLRENGMYENATIIITADNGDTAMNQNPLLLVKEKGKSEGYTVSDAPVSLFDLPSTVASTATARYSSYGSGRTFFDAENSKSSRIRYFYLNAGSNADSRIEEYKCTADAADSSKLTLMNNFYIFGGEVENYVLGTELKFTTDETAAVYCTEGFGHTNGWRTILRGPVGQMVIPIESIPESAPDLHVYFNVMSVYENTACVIRANGKVVFDRELDSSVKKNGLNFRVPASVIGPDNTLTLDFEFPDVDQSELNLGANERTAIIAFTSFKIYTQ